jgi:hypothetical protein
MAEKLIKKVKKVLAKPSEEKGLLDVSSIPGLKVIEIKTRKFTQYDFDFTYPGCKVEFPIVDINDIKDAIVKINVKIRYDDIHKINIKEFEDMLRENAYIVKSIIPQIIKIRRTRIKELTTDLPPIKAVEVWLIDKKHKDSDEVFFIADEIIRTVGVK